MSKLDDEYPISRINVDDEERRVPKGEYRYALNVRNGTPYIKKGGVATNVKGNVIIPTYLCPYNRGAFPDGRNKTIGAYEDTIKDTVVFFNWNSKGKHGIYRWYKGKKDSNNPFGIVEQVIQYNFGWKQNERITSINYVVSTSGDLVYWIDSTGLRKINIDRANINDKIKSWNFYYPVTNPFTVSSVFKFNLYDVADNLIVGVSINLGTYDSTKLGIEGLATKINEHPVYKNFVVAEACSCHLVLTEKTATSFKYEYKGRPRFGSNPFPCIVVPVNWYGISLTDRMFDRVPYPPLNAPLAEYRNDPQTVFNNVKNKVFQFCLEYNYCDFEKTVLGVYSQIPINNLQCDGTVNEAYNYIHINFNDDQLPLSETLTILKDVAVLAKEGNKATFREVLRVEPCDFLDYDYTTNKWFCFYNFYNNIISTVTTNNPERLESGVPIMANAEIFNKDRFVEGGVVLGRDNVDCVDADYKIQIIGEQPKLYKINGIIRVFNPFMDNAPSIPSQFEQPNILERTGGIFYDPKINSVDTDPAPTIYPFFGGSFYRSNNFELRSDWTYNLFKQILPEAGWPVYAAGTNFFAISKQVQRQGLTQRKDASIDVSTDEQLDQVSLFYGNRGQTPTTEQQMFSTFELLVPPGEYIIRLASHWCSYNDKLGRGYMYDLNNQKEFHQTSTHVWGVNDYRRGYQYDYEIKVTVTNSDVYIGEFLVADLVTGYMVNPNPDAPKGVPHASVSGYLIDQNGETDLLALSLGVRVEKAYIQVNNQRGAPTSYIRKYTDHNGYFYLGFLENNFNAIPDIVAYQVGGIMHTQGAVTYMATMGGYEPAASFSTDQESALLKLRNQNISTSDFKYEPSSAGGLFYGELILPCNEKNRRYDSSTFIIGKVVDANNVGLSNILVLYEHGRWDVSDYLGNYKILAWGDMRTASQSQPSISNNNRILDNLIFIADTFCIPVYPNGQESLVLITGFGLNSSIVPPPYSPTAIYKANDFVIIDTNQIRKSRKRGGAYIDSIRYYDEQGRYCSCEKLYEMYIPFQTEDLGKFPQVVDSNGIPYPLGTYIGGKPIIKWQLNYNPPQYAAYYQIMRTKNLYYGRYLQWIVSSVVYLGAVKTEATPEIETDYKNGNAVAIKLSINNIISYYANNPGSLVSYTYTAGDRVRIMYDRNFNTIRGLQDFEIISFDAQTQSIVVKNLNDSYEIKSGFTIEIYNSKSVDSEDTQVFYEVGEVYKCTAPNTLNNQHSVTSGVFTNGDTYWYGRNILVSDDRENFGANYPLIVESASVSDFFSSESQDIGRLGLIDPNLKQIYYPSRLIVSDQFQQDSAFNGLSSFSALNTKDEGRQYGEVSRFFMIGKVLHAIMKNNNISNYVGVITFQYAQSAQGVQAIADDYLGTQNPSLTNLGTQHPACVASYDGYIYGISDLRKSAWRYAQDGMNEISRNTYTDATGVSRTRMVNYFKDLCDKGVWDAVGVYDKRYREYIVSVWKTKEAVGVTRTQISRQDNTKLAIVRFNSIETINDGDDVDVSYVDSLTGETVEATVTVRVDTIYLPNIPPITNIRFIVPQGTIKDNVKVKYRGEGKTIAWNEEKNGWTTEYSFLPEVYCTLGDELVSFKDGKLWLHDNNPIHNNFYGVQYETVITPIFNDESNNVKVWNALWCMMYQDNNKCNFYSDKVSNNNGQLSRLKAPNFVKKEEFWFTEFKGDLNDTTVNNPIINGRRLRSTALSVELKNNHTGEINMYGWRVNWTNSERTSK